jgi:tetratricopeptide (TPR) repeat protein
LLTLLRVSPLFAVGALVAAAAWWVYHASQPEYRLRQGQEALQRGEMSRAESIAAGLEASGYANHARLLRGQILLESQDYAAALASLNEIQDKGALRLEAVSLCGQCLLKLGESHEAERTFAYLLSEQPESIDANRGLAAAYFDQGNLHAAIHYSREWARLDDRDGRPHRFLGLIYKELNHAAEAVPCYREALQHDLKEEVKEEVRQELAECLLMLRKPAEALQILDQAHPPEALVAKALVLRAEALRGQNARAEAAALVEQALRLDPDLPEALKIRGWLYLDANQPQAAARVLEKAVQLKPVDYTSHYNLVTAYTRLGRAADAKAQEKRLKEIQGYLEELSTLAGQLATQPHNPALHARTAELYDKLNLPKVADRWRHNAAFYSIAPSLSAGSGSPSAPGPARKGP